MEFEWDAVKADSNFAKHGIDFEEALDLFEDPALLVIAAPAGTKPRYLAIGEVGGEVLSVAYTMRGDICRLVSARRASRRERDTIIRYKPGPDPKPVGRTDWKRVKAMTDDEVETAALSDPDNLPLTEEQLATARRAMPSVRALRLHLGMTQEQFAKAYQLPIGTIRDWEQGRTRPDAPAQALLKVIEREPETVRKALGIA